MVALRRSAVVTRSAQGCTATQQRLIVVHRLPMLESPIGPHPILAAAQPPPLINDAVGTAKRRHECRRLPCCRSRVRRRPHPAEPAAVQPRRDRAVHGLKPRERRAAARDRRRFGVAGSRRCRWAWGSPPAIHSMGRRRRQTSGPCQRRHSLDASGRSRRRLQNGHRRSDGRGGAGDDARFLARPVTG